jgi:hypothetical protein
MAWPSGGAHQVIFVPKHHCLEDSRRPSNPLWKPALFVNGLQIETKLHDVNYYSSLKTMLALNVKVLPSELWSDSCSGSHAPACNLREFLRNNPAGKLQRR